MGLGRSLICSFFMILTLRSSKHLVLVNGQLTSNFYDRTCPMVGLAVRQVITARYTLQPNIAPGLLRLHFSDCFVGGCDGSVLISGPNTERNASFNANLRGFEVIDEIKRQLEIMCPGVVSCADILALAALEAVTFTGGPRWSVRLGRRDGRVSLKENVRNLSGSDVPTLVDIFGNLGLTREDYVALTGAHTIGTASCKYVGDGSCPSGPSSRVALDRGSQFSFDTSIYRNIINNNGVLKTDQDLSTDPNTSPMVSKFLNRDKFYSAFTTAMVKMTEIGVLTGTNGEIRHRCSAVNQ